MIFRKTKFLFFAFLLCYSIANAQEKPIGYWSSLMCYNTAIGVATDGNILYAISNQAFFTVNTLKGEVNGYSKVNGMSDIGMQCIGYDRTTSTTILVYANGNIDLFKDNTFYNIPDFKLKTIAGDKTVYSVYTENGRAYLSSTQGIIVLDLANQDIMETYQFFNGSQLMPVTDFSSAGKYFYATTANALYRADKNNEQLQNFQVWQKIDSTHHFGAMGSLNNSLYLSDLGFDTLIYIRTGVKHYTNHTKNYGVYKIISDSITRLFAVPDSVIKLDPGPDRLLISSYHPYSGSIRVMDTNFKIIDSFGAPGPIVQAVQILDSSIWFANVFSGLGKKEPRVKQMGFYSPAGPGDAPAVDMYANNGEIYIAHGGHDDALKSLGNKNGISTFSNGRWTNYRNDIYYPYPPFADSMYDFVTIAKDESDGTLYAGSFSGGLFELHTDKSYTIYKQGSILDHSQPNGVNTYQVLGSAFDHNGNFWVTLYGSYHELYVKEKATGTWYKYHLNIPRFYPFSAGQMAVDDANNIWYVCPLGGGVIRFNPNGTLADTTDDEVYHLAAGAGAGNLPNVNAGCIAHDKNDNMWIGTSDGIGIVYGASGCKDANCQAQIPIVQYDKYAGYLFSGENVRTIAVDGANRKWIGTDNGVWLLSPDAGNSSIIYRFTADNSPLPSNHIQKITIDGVTGDVYIGTEAGLVSYRSTATEGTEAASNVVTFPNPVPSGYKGTIGIKGLPANSDVRITDINGQLVYRTTALGGQAVWNGIDYKGHRPQSGVYLIFASNSDGTQVYAGKMIFMN